MNYGVCGHTYIKIRPGTYNEQVYIGPIPGTGINSTVTFLSSNNDSSSVKIYFTGSASDNYAFRLFNVSHIKFHRITIQAPSSYYTAINLSGSIEHILFTNCEIIGTSTTSSSTSRAVIYRNYDYDSDKTTNLSFNQTMIRNGSYGIYLYNSSSNYLNGFYVTNCVFKDQYYTNLYCYYSQNIGINGNIFERNSSSRSDGYGVRFYSSNDSMTIVQNRIIQKNAGYGLYLNYAYGSSTKRNLIANNFISCYSSSNDGYDAIILEYSSYTDLVFNNVHRSCTGNYYALRVNEGSNIRLFNNNFNNALQGNSFFVSSSSNNCIEKSNRNNFYNAGNALGIWYGSAINVVSDLKSLGTDSNSVSANPNYTSASDLHAYNVDLDGNARPFGNLTKDIDGQTRNTATPDIGADEFSLLSLDASVADIKLMLPGTSCLKVVLRNMGTTTITSAKIDWKLNGVSKSQVNWTGSLAKGDTDIVCLGNYPFHKDTMYNLLAWSSAPNSGTDLFAANDTLEVDFYTLMNGEYTIGGTSPDFATFTDAVDAVESHGIQDSVLFKVRNGTYTEQIEINKIYGATHTNSIIFQSESKDSSKVILRYSPTAYDYNYVVWLNGANGISFRKMTIDNQSSSYSKTVLINNSSKNLYFENNIIQNPDSLSSSTDYALIHLDNNIGQNIYLLRNILNKGAYALASDGDYSSREKNIVIRGNRFKKQGYVPLYFYGIEQLTIADNSIDGANNTADYGIYIQYLRGASTINNNRIQLSGNDAQAGVYIYEFPSDPVPDSLNIYNNFVSVAGSNAGYGFYLYYLNNTN